MISLNYRNAVSDILNNPKFYGEISWELISEVLRDPISLPALVIIIYLGASVLVESVIDIVKEERENKE